MVRSLRFLIADIWLFEYFYIPKKFFLVMVCDIAIKKVAIKKISLLTDMVFNIIAIVALLG